MRVRDTLHHLHIQNQLLTIENKGLEQALRQQKKGNKKSRALPVIQRQDWEADTQLWSPSRVNKAQQLQDEADKAEKAEEIRKLTQLSFVKLLASSSRSLMLRRQRSERERRRSGMKGRQKSAVRLMPARLIDSVSRRRKTVNKLYNCPKKAREQPHKL